MDWFNDIPKLFLIFTTIIALIGTLGIINSVDLENPNNINENLEKTTEYMVDNAIPTEINLILWLTNKLSRHPFLLTGSILAVSWLFGYLPAKGR